MNFILGGITVHLVAASEFTQGYQRVGGGRARSRRQNGTLKTSQHWTKIATELSGSGNVPFGLSDLDYSQNMTLSCGGPRSITSISNIIAIPAARRSDAGHTPFGFAIFDSYAVATPVSMAANTATLTPVAGALSYTVSYFPELIVAVEEPAESLNRSSGVWSWSISAEEA